MNAEEFIQAVSKGGYADKETTKRYIEKTGRAEFDESDYIEVYRMKENRLRHDSPKWRNYQGTISTKRLKDNWK